MVFHDAPRCALATIDNHIDFLCELRSTQSVRGTSKARLSETVATIDKYH
jgi:hypothetical protein